MNIPVLSGSHCHLNSSFCPNHVGISEQLKSVLQFFALDHGGWEQNVLLIWPLVLFWSSAHLKQLTSVKFRAKVLNTEQTSLSSIQCWHRAAYIWPLYPTLGWSLGKWFALVSMSDARYLDMGMTLDYLKLHWKLIKSTFQQMIPTLKRVSIQNTGIQEPIMA